MLYIAHSRCLFDEDENAREGIDFFTSLEEAQQFKEREESYGDIYVDIYEAKRIK